LGPTSSRVIFRPPSGRPRGAARAGSPAVWPLGKLPFARPPAERRFAPRRVIWLRALAARALRESGFAAAVRVCQQAAQLECGSGARSIPGAAGAASLDSSHRRAETLKALVELLGVAETSAANVRRSAPMVGHMFRWYMAAMDGGRRDAVVQTSEMADVLAAGICSHAPRALSFTIARIFSTPGHV